MRMVYCRELGASAVLGSGGVRVDAESVGLTLNAAACGVAPHTAVPR